MLETPLQKEFQRVVAQNTVSPHANAENIQLIAVCLSKDGKVSQHLPPPFNELR
jgi:hypothetical protein